MSTRNITNYNILTNSAANETATAKIYVGEARNIGLTISTSNTAFNGTIRIKGSRTEFGQDITFTTTVSQTNKWSYIQISSNDTGANLNGTTGLVLTASSDEVENYAINIDGFNWITAEVSSYTTGDVNVDVSLYNNQ